MTSAPRRRRVLVVDVGGTHIKVWLAGRKEPVKIDSGPHMTAARMAREVRAATADWRFDVITIGYPGPVKDDRPAREPVKIDSGPHMTAARMAREVRAATADWRFDVITIGYPGPVKDDRPAREPFNLGDGWVGFPYQRALHHPVRIVNDAALQALGSYAGGHMLFLG